MQYQAQARKNHFKSYRCVNKTLSATHGVEEKLSSSQTSIERISNKTFSLQMEDQTLSDIQTTEFALFEYVGFMIKIKTKWQIRTCHKYSGMVLF